MAVLILGGGVGGLVAARSLRRRLSRRHRIIVVDRERDFSFAPSYLWVMTGSRLPKQITRSRSRLEAAGIEVVTGELQRIDPAKREVVVDGRPISADTMVVALGAELAEGAIPGLFEGGETFATLDGAVRLKSALSSLRDGRVLFLTAAPSYRCPAAPYEAALLLDAYWRHQGVRDKVTLEFYAAEPGPMGVAGPEVSAAVRAMIQSRGIGYHPEQQVTAVEPGARVARFAGGNTIPYDLLIFTPPYRAPRVVRDSQLAGDGGWIAVDRNSLETRFPQVYAIGDVTSIPLSMGKPLPKAGVFAHGQGTVVAANIAAAISGRRGDARFDGHGGCFVEAGAGRAGYGAGNFFAEPKPAVRLRGPGVGWHLAKVAYEKYFLRTWA